MNVVDLMLIPSAAETKKEFKLISSVDLTNKPMSPDWLIKGMIEKKSISLLFGEPGSYKSFVALDWAFCVACGLEWHGHKTKNNDVVIIAGEGFSGYSRRIKALEQKHNRKAPNLFISKRPANLCDNDSAEEIASAIRSVCKNPGLIIIDTLHRNMIGDENSSQDIGVVVSNIDQALKPLGVAVVVVHHSGHGAKDRSRGSSSIRGAMDSEFGTTKTGTGLTLTCHKMKDYEATLPLSFDFKVADLDGWTDEDGRVVTSGVLEFKGAAEFPSKKSKLSPENTQILESLDKMILNQGVKPNTTILDKYKGEIKYTKVVSASDWREDAMKFIFKDNPATKRQAFNRCKNALIKCGKIFIFDECVFIKLNQ